MYTRTKFEVITAVSVLPEKIDALNAVIETQEPGKITMLLADTYVPFQSENLENMDAGQKETTQ
jgi:cell division protein FtsQ